MIGPKTLSAIKTEIRDAFGRKGVDIESWLNEQMAKLRGKPGTTPAALESLRLLRDGSRNQRAPAKGKRNTRKKK